MTHFQYKVIRIVSHIPKGQTLTYKKVATKAGSPFAYRAVGNILNSYDASKIKIPCYRVVRSDGKVGGYRWGVEKKIALLQKERSARVQEKAREHID